MGRQHRHKLPRPPVSTSPVLWALRTDLAMTGLSGGAGPDFYAAYHATWPVGQGFAARKILYNLYPILNHLNLFGGGYAKPAETLPERRRAALR